MRPPSTRSTVTTCRVAARVDRLRRARLYLVIAGLADDDGKPDGAMAPSALLRAFDAGVDAVQLRMKGVPTQKIAEQALRLRALLRARPTLIFVNDDYEAAIAGRADGVHLGQEDAPIERVRQKVGPDLLIGLSTHSLKQAQGARARGADYVGVGSMFPTATKDGAKVVGPEVLPKILRSARVPVFPIGGIDVRNVERIVAQGAGRAAIARAIVRAEDPAQAARVLRFVLERAPLVDAMTGTGE